MRYLLIAALAALMGLTLNAADLAGTWKGSMETQMGESAVALTFQPGAKLAGKAKLGEYDGTIEKAVLDGDQIDFEISIGPGKLVFHGTVAGDEIKFNVVGTQGNSYSLVCRRQK